MASKPSLPALSTNKGELATHKPPVTAATSSKGRMLSLLRQLDPAPPKFQASPPKVTVQLVCSEIPAVEFHQFEQRGCSFKYLGRMSLQGNATDDEDAGEPTNIPWRHIMPIACPGGHENTRWVYCPSCDRYFCGLRSQKAGCRGSNFIGPRDCDCRGEAEGTRSVEARVKQASFSAESFAPSSPQLPSSATSPQLSPPDRKRLK